VFKVIVGLKYAGKHETFQAAFVEFFTKVSERMEGGVSAQVLVTTNFIEHSVEPSVGRPAVKCRMNPSQARNFAQQVGLLSNEGELQHATVNILDFVVDLAFMSANLSNVTETSDNFLEDLKNL